MNAIIILDVKNQPFISVGRHYGGCRINGQEYYYEPNHDAYIRKDWVRKYAKAKKAGKSWEDFLEEVKAAT